MSHRDVETNVETISRSTPRRSFLWSLLTVLIGLMFGNGGPGYAGSLETVLDGTYAGGFAAAGIAENTITDVTGFSNWGNPGSTSGYDEAAPVGGVLVGKKFTLGSVPLRVELDGTFGDISAKTNRLDPQALDETARSEFQWVATARAGVEHTLGPVTLFANGGLATARIAESVTDIDGLPQRHVDPDDSFRKSATKIGWVVGVGLEIPLTDAWKLRLDGSYMDFGRSTRYVNHSGNNRCGPGGPAQRCPYRIENELGLMRVGLVYRFGS